MVNRVKLYHPAVPLSNGVATFSISALAVGSHAIVATYSGDSSFNASAAAHTHIVTSASKANSTTAFTSTPRPSAVGQAGVFTATVTGQGSTPTGNVTFSEGSATLGTAPLSNGVATFSISALAVGSHAITAAYGGDGSFNASTLSVTQTVTESGSSTQNFYLPLLKWSGNPQCG